jgi:hypothetical protein
MMSSNVADKAMTGDKEQIHIIIRQAGESIESEAIHGHKHGSREAGTFIELHPMGVVIVRMVIGHGTLN